MSDSDKPNPIDDLRKGLGLLFRAAKTTLDKLPTGQIEEAVITGAKEVGRALENVTHTVEEQFLRKPTARPADEAPSAAASAKDPAPEEASKEPSKEPPTEPENEKKRVG
jgi:hypothetical protein